QRGESELLQVPCRADVPRIRNHETACLMQSAESPATGSEVLLRSPVFRSDKVRCHRFLERVHPISDRSCHNRSSGAYARSTAGLRARFTDLLSQSSKCSPPSCALSSGISARSLTATP